MRLQSWQFSETLYGFASLYKDGSINIKGKKTTWKGGNPWEDGYDMPVADQVDPAISSRHLI